jgi:ATP-dependent DNA helicase PIF1
MLIAENSFQAELFRHAQVIVIDEISMLHITFFRILELTARLLKRINAPFGGMTIITAGDFKQAAPIVTEVPSAALETATCNASIISSEICQTFQVFKLTEPQRNKHDPRYATFCESIGLGTTMTFVPPAARVTHDPSDPNVFDPSVTTLLAILHTTVDAFNEKILRRTFFDDQIRTYEAKYHSHDDNYALALPFDIISHNQRDAPPHALSLAVGCRVIILRNILASEGLANGTMCEITRLNPNSITVIIKTGRKAGNSATLFRIAFPLRGAATQCNRLQLPVTLAYAITVNKSQAKTLDKVIYDCSDPPFTHGQLYIALTRVRSSDDIHFFNPRNSITTNIVYKRLIHSLH